MQVQIYINYPVSWKSRTSFIKKYINIVLQISIHTLSIIWFFKQSFLFESQLIDNGHTIHIDFVLFTHSNSEFGALSATEQSFDHACTAPISQVFVGNFELNLQRPTWEQPNPLLITPKGDHFKPAGEAGNCNMALLFIIFFSGQSPSY